MTRLLAVYVAGVALALAALVAGQIELDLGDGRPAGSGAQVLSALFWPLLLFSSLLKLAWERFST